VHGSGGILLQVPALMRSEYEDDKPLEAEISEGGKKNQSPM